jgi:hypothetical protein
MPLARRIFTCARSPRTLIISAAIALGCNACAPEIGDDCETDLDCSAQGSRPCDRTQPGGYCTIRGCEARTCPEESVCVKFRPQVERLAVTYCMFACASDDDCRTNEGYLCLRADEFGAEGDAQALDRGRRFCAIQASLPDAGVIEQ